MSLRGARLGLDNPARVRSRVRVRLANSPPTRMEAAVAFRGRSIRGNPNSLYCQSMDMKTNRSRRADAASARAFYIPVDRRRFFRSMALASAGFTLPGYLAEALTLTPQVTQGPYYPLASTTNANDMVLTGITDAAQRASVIKDFTAVSGTTTGEMETTWDIVMGLTPVEPTYPGGGSLVVAGTVVAGPSGPRYRITIPAYAGYSYEIYGNPTLGSLAWGALPFSLSQLGTIDRNIYTATSEGTLNLYLEAKAAKGFYYISFRVPG